MCFSNEPTTQDSQQNNQRSLINSNPHSSIYMDNEEQVANSEQNTRLENVGTSDAVLNEETNEIPSLVEEREVSIEVGTNNEVTPNLDEENPVQTQKT